MVASISFVADELIEGKDELARWAKNNSALFVDVDDQATQGAYAQIVEALSEQAPIMKKGALEEFLSGADPWLIAKAMVSGAVVVTHESYNLAARRKFLIPNVCKQFGVQWINTFELLQRLDAKFVLPKV